MALFSYTRKTFSRELSMLALALVFCIPLYLLVVISLKTTSSAYLSPLSFPTKPHFGSYSAALRGSGSGGLDRALLNSTIITIGSLASLIAFGSIAAYALARRPSRLSTLLYLLFVVGIVLPIQLAVIPLYVLLRQLHLLGSYAGMILMYTGLLMPLTVFLYTGFVRTLPREYEEAAQVDGASLFRTYARVVFPLLLPVTGTVAIIDGLVIWNDFFVPVIFLSGSTNQTLPVAIYSFVSENASQWNVIFAGVAIAIAPILAFYAFAQRQLIRGFSGGIRG
jgi:raffinose/stachyose/melibiose transport system permease protein